MTAVILMTKFQTQQIVKFGSDKIFIDGTHGTISYDIQLYTLMIIDEFGSGCPVGFGLPNRSNKSNFRVVFNAVKSS